MANNLLSAFAPGYGVGSQQGFGAHPGALNPGVSALLASTPADYAMTTKPLDRLQHALLIGKLRSEAGASTSVQLSWAPCGDHFSLWLVFYDRRGSLGAISSSLGCLGIDIVKASAFSTIDGVAVDSFTVNRMDEELAATLRMHLAASIGAFTRPESAAVDAATATAFAAASAVPRPIGAMLGSSRPLLMPLPFATDPDSDGTLPGDWEPHAALPPTAPPATHALEALVGGLEFDVTDVISMLEDQAIESDCSHTTSEDDQGGGEEEAADERSVHGKSCPSNSHKQRAPLSSPRWNVTPDQRKTLEAFFEQVPLPSRAARQLLATKMGVSPQQIKVWFRNRRQRKRVSGQGGQGGSGGHSLGTLQQSGNSYGDWGHMDVSKAE
jgi:hypothetical protein